jgi:hypothetical protein
MAGHTPWKQIKKTNMWDSLAGRDLEPHEHMGIALHESECIPRAQWDEMVSANTLEMRYMNYRWCDHHEDHHAQAAAMFGSLYLQRRGT